MQEVHVSYEIVTLRQVYEDIPDHQVLIEFESDDEAEVFREWLRKEGDESYHSYKEEHCG